MFIREELPRKQIAIDKEVMWSREGVFIFPYSRQYEVAQYLQKQYPRWMTCDEIASNLYGVSPKDVRGFITNILNSPGGQDAIETQMDPQTHTERYRYIKY